MPTDICFLFLLKSVSWLKVPTYLLPFSEIISNGFAVFVLITVGMRPYRYLTGFPKAKDKEITLLPIFCYQSAKKNPCRIRQGLSMYKPRIHSYPLYLKYSLWILLQEYSELQTEYTTRDESPVWDSHPTILQSLP